MIHPLAAFSMPILMLLSPTFTSTTNVSAFATKCSSVYSSNKIQRTETATLFSATSPIQEEIRYISGRRALILHPPRSSASSYPPLVILGGMAQSIASWEFHMQQLCSSRSVMMYEALGQGPPPPLNIRSDMTLEQYFSDVTLDRQGRDFWDVINEAFFHPDSYYYQNFVQDGVGMNKQVDVAGFSFGGRVAMAAATIQPLRIRRLHLTGVGADRDEYANVILSSWKDILGVNSDKSAKESNRIRAFAWAIILSTYSEQFLSRAGAKRVQLWVDGVCQYNTVEGLKAILIQTHGTHTDNLDNGKQAMDDMWTPASMAQCIRSNECVESCRILVGSEDRISSIAQSKRLAQLLGLQQNNSTQDEERVNLRVVDGCGHAVPMEAKNMWREDVLTFFEE